jgi:uncharacterized protein (TIGR04255 family)
MNRTEDILPHYDNVLFKNPALELSLVQLKYPPIPRFAEENFLTGIKEALAEEYPLVSVEQGMNIVISLQGIGQSPGSNMLRFNTLDSLWSVVLTNETVSLETREYTSIKEFVKRWTNILDIVATYLQPRHQLRIGLRYINEFRHPAGDNYVAWSQWLNPELVGVNLNNMFGGNIEQTISEIRTRREDGMMLLRHGFLKGTTIIPTLSHPAKTGPFYLLDLDYYDETATRFNTSSSADCIVRYNDFLYRIFRWSIGEDELYQYLRGEL